MGMHARGHHKLGYQVYLDNLAVSKNDELAVLRKRVDDLMAAMLNKAESPRPKRGRPKAKQRAAAAA